jgi:hypothetical protein
MLQHCARSPTARASRRRGSAVGSAARALPLHMHHTCSPARTVGLHATGAALPLSLHAWGHIMHNLCCTGCMRSLLAVMLWGCARPGCELQIRTSPSWGGQLCLSMPNSIFLVYGAMGFMDMLGGPTRVWLCKGIGWPACSVPWSITWQRCHSLAVCRYSYAVNEEWQDITTTARSVHFCQSAAHVQAGCHMQLSACEGKQARKNRVTGPYHTCIGG